MSAKQLKNAPVCSIDMNEISFGEVHKNAAKEQTIVIKNTGKTPLKVRAFDISSSLFKTNSSSMEIPAGGSANIVISFKANNRITTHNATIDVISNDPNNPIQTIKVTAKVI